MADEPKVGATGAFPEGKLNEHDEGELRFRVGANRAKNVVVVEFGTPVWRMAMPPETARQMATALKTAFDVMMPPQPEPAPAKKRRGRPKKKRL